MSSTGRRSSGRLKSPGAGLLNSPPPKMPSKQSRSLGRSPKQSLSDDTPGSRRLSVPDGVLSPSNRSNIQPDQDDVTADSSLIGKLMDDLMMPGGGSEKKKGKKAASVAPEEVENPSQILNRRLSHHRRRSEASPRPPSAAESVGEAPGGAAVEESRQAPAATTTTQSSSSQAEAANRRLTADASELDQFFRDMLMSPKARTKRASMPQGRRETADPDALRLLISELRSPGASKATLDRVLKELGCSPSDNPEWSRLTVDQTMLGRLTDDLDTLLTDELQAPSARPSTPASARRRGQDAPSSAGRRLTADPCSLASLGLMDMDVSISSSGGRRQSQQQQGAPSSGGKKGKTPPRQTRRRDTASPGVLAELLEELDAAGGGGQSWSAAAAAEEMTSGEEGMERGSAKKSPRRTARATASATPSLLQRATEEVPAEPEAAASSSSAAAPEFSMSPPRPTPASARRPLRSCLSSKRKTRPDPSSPTASATKKSVVFGSPDAAVFFKGSPSNSLTPMTKRDVQRHFPSLHGLEEAEPQREEEEVEEGVTATNSAILAAWGDGASDEDEEEEEEVEAPRSSSSSKRKRTSRSPRTQRRQSLLIQSGSSKGYGIRDEEEEEEEEEDRSDRRASLSRRLSDRMVDGEGEEEGAVPMDVSPSLEDDMPDIGQRSPSFRSRDERTSAELGILGVTPLAPPPVLRLDENDERTVELEQDLHSLMQQADGGSNDGLAVRAPIAAPTTSDDFTQHSVGGAAPEDRTVELEADLDSLLQSAPMPAAPCPPKRPAAPLPEDTVQLELDLGALITTADDEVRPVDPERASMMEMSVMDESDDGTVEYEEDDAAHDMRLSLDSTDGSPCSAGTEQLSIGMPPPRKSPITFSLSFTAPDTPQSAASSSHGIARFRKSSSSSQATPSSRSSSSGLTPSEGERPKGPTPTSGRTRQQQSASRSSLSRSPSTSLGGQHLLEESTTDSSPFANIRVGRSTRSDTLAVSSTTGTTATSINTSQATAKSPRTSSSSSLLSTIPSDTTGSDESMVQTDAAVKLSSSSSSSSSSESLMPATSPSGDGSSDTSITVSPLAGDDTPQEPATGNSEENMEEEEPEATPPTQTPASAPISLDWTSAGAFQQPAAAEEDVIVRLLHGESLPQAPAVVQQAVHQVLREGATQVMSQLESEALLLDMEALEEAVESRAAALAEGSAPEQDTLLQLLQQAIPRAAEVVGKRWWSLERKMVEVACARVKEEVERVQSAAERLEAKCEELQAIQDRKAAVLAGMKKAKVQQQVEALRARVAEQKQSIEGSQAELSELQGKRDALRDRITTVRAEVAALNKARALEEKLAERDRLERTLVGLQEKGDMLRFLYLAQPTDLQSDSLTFRYSHPNNSRTELHLALSDGMVTGVTITNESSCKRRGSPRTRSLLHHVLQWPFFSGPQADQAGPTKAGEGAWTWRTRVPCSQIKPALRRFEIIIGRVNLLILMVQRTEEAFTCTLTLGEHVLQREAWVEDCLYGSSTTCAFEHNHGQSPEGPGSRLVRRCQPSALLPHCIGMLTVQLQPERATRRASTGRGERTVLKLVLSLSFLTHIPARLEPSLRQAGPARSDLLGKMAPLLSRRFGDSRAPPLGPMEGGPASALLQACRQVEAFLSQA